MQDTLTLGVALLLVLTLGRRYLGREHLATEVTPGAPEREAVAGVPDPRGGG